MTSHRNFYNFSLQLTNKQLLSKTSAITPIRCRAEFIIIWVGVTYERQRCPLVGRFYLSSVSWGERTYVPLVSFSGRAGYNIKLLVWRLTFVWNVTCVWVEMGKQFSYKTTKTIDTKQVNFVPLRKMNRQLHLIRWNDLRRCFLFVWTTFPLFFRNETALWRP